MTTVAMARGIVDVRLRRSPSSFPSAVWTTAVLLRKNRKTSQGSFSLCRNQIAKRAPVMGALCILVEARGIEPQSENHLIQLSPSAVRLLGFPSRIAGGQAMRYGSHYAVTEGVASPCSRSPLIGALFSAAVLRDRTGCIN